MREGDDVVEKDVLKTETNGNPTTATTPPTQESGTTQAVVGTDNEPPAYICFFVDTRAAPVSAAKLSNVPIPPAFARVQELLGVQGYTEALEGGVERLFVPHARVYAYDDAGLLVNHLPMDP